MTRAHLRHPSAEGGRLLEPSFRQASTVVVDVKGRCNLLKACQKCWNVNACSRVSRAESRELDAGSDITRTRYQLTLRCLRFDEESRCVQLVRLRAREALGDTQFMKTDTLVVFGHVGSVSTELPTETLDSSLSHSG
jgi:hypothetical protein